MSTENEEKKPAESPEHSSWIEKAIEKINVDFPLSGGETDADLEKVKDPAEKPDHPSWIEKALDKIGNEFPLSGGETEEDFK